MGLRAVLSSVMEGVVHYHLVDEIEEALVEVALATSDMEESVHHTHTHAHMHAHTHTHTHTRMHACMHAHTHTCTHAHTCYYATLDNPTM